MKQILPLILLLAITAPAIAQTTQPDEGPPVPPAWAPSYLQVGKDLTLRIQLFREAVAELPLDASVHTQANKLMDDVSTETNDLITQMQSGQMPPNQRVVTMPQKIKDARQHLLDLIGPTQAARLQEKITSIRGQARLALGHLHLMLDNLALSADKKDKTIAIITRAREEASALPDTTQPPDDTAKSTDAMNHLLATTHDNLTKILSPEEQSQLGPKFAQLALATPATQP